MKPRRNRKNPSLHEIVKVSQMGSDFGFFFVMMTTLVCMSPVSYFMLRLDMAERFFSLLFSLSIVLFLISIVGGLCAGVWLVSKWEKQLFSQTIAVTVDAQGMTIEGLGKSPWADILSIEKIPRGYSMFIVHTRRFGRVSLSMHVATAVPVFEFYLDQPQHLDGVMGSFGASTPVFKLYVFSLWRFRLWIALGYLAGAASVVGTVLIGGNRSGLEVLIALGTIVPMVASMVWFFPLMRLSAFRAKHVRAFTVRAGRLQSTDGQWDIDLKKADINCHRAHGLGYDFEVVSIRSPGSKRLDVGMPVEELTPLLDGLASRHNTF